MVRRRTSTGGPAVAASWSTNPAASRTAVKTSLLTGIGRALAAEHGRAEKAFAAMAGSAGRYRQPDQGCRRRTSARFRSYSSSVRRPSFLSLASLRRLASRSSTPPGDSTSAS